MAATHEAAVVARAGTLQVAGPPLNNDEVARAERSKLIRQARGPGTAAESGAHSRPTVLAQVLAGSGSGVLTKSSVAPIERLKVIFQTSGMREGVQRYQTPMQSIRLILVRAASSAPRSHAAHAYTG